MNAPVVLITGCSGGIGLACVHRFAESGHAVCGVDLSPSPESGEAIGRSGGTFYEADVARMDEARRIVESVRARHGRLDALVTCAGISRDGGVEELPESDWDRVIDVDLKGTYSYIAASAPVFRAQRSGKIVTIASTLALRARRGLTNYAAAKAGVVGLTRAAARDLGRHNVNVNAVAPGLVQTPLAEAVPPDVRKRLIEETCLGRLASAEDVANVIHFLCTEAARHITGEVLRVDGGQLA